LQAFLPSLVPPRLLPRAIAGSSSANQVATICGPAIGGLVFAFSPTLAYVLCTALFLLSPVLITLIRAHRPEPQRRPADLASIFAGIGFIRGRPLILGSISLDMFAVLLGGATALLPIFA